MHVRPEDIHMHIFCYNSFSFICKRILRIVSVVVVIFCIYIWGRMGNMMRHCSFFGFLFFVNIVVSFNSMIAFVCTESKIVQFVYK